VVLRVAKIVYTGVVMRTDYAAYLAVARMYAAAPTLAHWRLLLAVSDLVKFMDTHLGHVRKR
jgi:hypothetical protein